MEYTYMIVAVLFVMAIAVLALRSVLGKSIEHIQAVLLEKPGQWVTFDEIVTSGVSQVLASLLLLELIQPGYPFNCRPTDQSGDMHPVPQEWEDVINYEFQRNSDYHSLPKRKWFKRLLTPLPKMQLA